MVMNWRPTGNERRDAVWNYYEIEYIDCKHRTEVAAGGKPPDECRQCTSNKQAMQDVK
jgi:hypothetical protein